jgi:hypothetical protein
LELPIIVEVDRVRDTQKTQKFNEGIKRVVITLDEYSSTVKLEAVKKEAKGFNKIKAGLTKEPKPFNSQIQKGLKPKKITSKLSMASPN